ncbi:TPR-like protein [Calocera viscosa TUFC12733]|uniref:TPR-like protein n=1 Tax=Calocera viscosa (strain TUFC12733) TaxID=1330018 RepID=A0A167GD96_CALVF|nr:TPR-like protein [Calocera viscosa TUFC12733]
MEQAFDTALTVAKEVLDHINSAADAFAPLKAITSPALKIYEKCKEFKDNQKQWRELGERVLKQLACVMVLMPKEANPSRKELQYSTSELETELNKILEHVEDAQKGGRFARYKKFKFGKNSKVEEDMKKFDDALERFKTRLNIITVLDVGEVKSILSKNMDVDKLLHDISSLFQEQVATIRVDIQEARNHIVSHMDTNKVVETLPYSEGVSFHPRDGCWPGTRHKLLEDIDVWISEFDASGAVQVYWLVDVGGSGKTAIAHSVSKKAFEKGQLVTSFFFNQCKNKENAERLISTIARDLASLDPKIATAMALLLEGEGKRFLRSAPPALQFKELILAPSVVSLYPTDRPILIVIDGLDEADDQDYINILTEEVPKLPGMFRFFITSRPRPEIVRSLSSVSVISKHDILIKEEDNMNDVELYIRKRLDEIAKQDPMSADWPGEDHSRQLVHDAEGLFQWAFTVMEFLSRCLDKKKVLRDVLDMRAPATVEAKLDHLYTTILNVCPWDDEGFVHGYQQFMGTVIAAKESLSVSTIQHLHKDPVPDAATILKYLAALLLGTYTSGEPTQLIHLTVREFLVDRSAREFHTARFHLGETLHSAVLAERCLEIINQDLNPDSHDLGFMSVTEEAKDLPLMRPQELSGALYYACRFWAVHLVDVDIPTASTIEALRQFSSTRLRFWVDLMVALHDFQPLDKVRLWLELHAPNEPELLEQLCDRKLGNDLRRLAHKLEMNERWEEACAAASESVAILRHGFSYDPDDVKADLAYAEFGLSNHLFSFGKKTEAMAHLEEAVKLQDAVVRDATSRVDLLHALKYLAAFVHVNAIRLSEMNRPAEALRGIDTVVQLYSTMPRDDSYPRDLVAALNTLSGRLSDVGRREEALSAIQRAVQLCRDSAPSNPQVSTSLQATSLETPSVHLSSVGHYEEASLLATSLENLSLRLSSVGQYEEAMRAIEEALTVKGTLAQPSTLTELKNQSDDFHNLADSLSDLGRHTEALAEINKSVAIRRKLVKSKPGVYETDLAIVLADMSQHLIQVGGKDAALSAAEEAVKLGRQSDRKLPGVYAGTLAKLLITNSKALFHLNRFVEALALNREAADLLRPLAEKEPAVYNEFYATVLNNLFTSANNAGEEQEGLDALEEAVKIRRELAAERPDVFNAHLASSLNNLSLALSQLGKQDEALSAIREAIDLRRDLAKKLPRAYKGLLAKSIFNLGVLLRGEREEEEENALVQIDAAVKLAEEVAAELPEGINDLLATFVQTQGEILFVLGRMEDSAQPHQRCLELSRELTSSQPGLWEASYSQALHRCYAVLWRLDRHEEALAVAEEAIGALRRASGDEAYPQQLSSPLADYLERSARCLAPLGRDEEALTAMKEALTYRRALAGAGEEDADEHLAECLMNNALLHRRLGQRSEAEALEKELTQPMIFYIPVRQDSGEDDAEAEQGAEHAEAEQGEGDAEGEQGEEHAEAEHGEEQTEAEHGEEHAEAGQAEDAETEQAEDAEGVPA